MLPPYILIKVYTIRTHQQTHIFVHAELLVIQERSVLILQFIYHSFIRSSQIIITIISIIIIINISSSKGFGFNHIMYPHLFWAAYHSERMCSLSWVCAFGYANVFVYITEEKTTTTDFYVLYSVHRKGSKETQLPLGKPSAYTLNMYVRAVASWYRAIVCRYFFFFCFCSIHIINWMCVCTTHTHTHMLCVYKHIDRMWSWEFIVHIEKSGNKASSNTRSYVVW